MLHSQTRGFARPRNTLPASSTVLLAHLVAAAALLPLVLVDLIGGPERAVLGVGVVVSARLAAARQATRRGWHWSHGPRLVLPVEGHVALAFLGVPLIAGILALSALVVRDLAVLIVPATVLLWHYADVWRLRASTGYGSPVTEMSYYEDSV
ncbi:hypothetical protein GKE82_23785 [Conexibacter sp. W3-3-2]|uniref:hypothetical protein n=1 Tax=Conexibacter sp. W3-3-2 TaxID=2675227 RepID=UPI0012BA1331|nr:hypothetical protein [Conexibacter sp. W3-3-2]MTD47228.1 hypothetical protein [Conexibacter sp. W3-3-2]